MLANATCINQCDIPIKNQLFVRYTYKNYIEFELLSGNEYNASPSLMRIPRSNGCEFRIQASAKTKNVKQASRDSLNLQL